jgi:cysteine desulfurase
MTIYLDCNATTPIEPEVLEAVIHYMRNEYGNASSRTHEFGARALAAVNRAREQLAKVVDAKPEEVIFTSGATESNNLAILGLAPHGEKTGRKHIVSTMIEHRAVLEPLKHLESRGFEVTLVPPTAGGWVDPDAVKAAIRKDTVLVSVMHVNNETGVIQPVEEIGDRLGGHPAYFHVDAAQGLGKELRRLKNKRIDLISASGHKIFAPKGIGALVARHRKYERPPLSPIMYGGAQERRLRPGTLPVHLIVGIAEAAQLAQRDHDLRITRCLHLKRQLLAALSPLAPVLHGAPEHMLPTTLNLSFPGIDSEALMVAWKPVIAASNGSACTSQRNDRSHVLIAMGLSEETIRGAVRLSWCHLTPDIDWKLLTRATSSLLQS